MDPRARLPVRVCRFLTKLGLLPRPEQKAIFIHIQKTAGTSLVRMISRYYSDSFISHADYLTKTADEVGKTQFVAGHFGYGYAKQFMHDRFSFTFIREPRDRIISFYKFCKSQPPHLEKIYEIANNHELNRFLELGIENSFVRDCIYNHQVWQLAAGWGDPSGATLHDYLPEAMLRDALEHTRRLSKVGFVADFDRDMRHILKQLNLPISAKPLWENKSVGNISACCIPPLTQRLLDPLVELDEKFYKILLEERSVRN